MDSPPVDPTLYRRFVGKIIFLANIRPDITHAVHQVAKFVQLPQLAHLQAAKSILCPPSHSVRSLDICFVLAVAPSHGPANPKLLFPSTESEYRALMESTCEAQTTPP